MTELTKEELAGLRKEVESREVVTDAAPGKFSYRRYCIDLLDTVTARDEEIERLKAQLRNADRMGAGLIDFADGKTPHKSLWERE